MLKGCRLWWFIGIHCHIRQGGINREVADSACWQFNIIDYALIFRVNILWYMVIASDKNNYCIVITKFDIHVYILSLVSLIISCVTLFKSAFAWSHLYQYHRNSCIFIMELISVHWTAHALLNSTLNMS